MLEHTNIHGRYATALAMWTFGFALLYTTECYLTGCSTENTCFSTNLHPQPYNLKVINEDTWAWCILIVDHVLFWKFLPTFPMSENSCCDNMIMCINCDVRMGYTSNTELNEEIIYNTSFCNGWNLWLVFCLGGLVLFFFF
jgi:hypothetical protein